MTIVFMIIMLQYKDDDCFNDCDVVKMTIVFMIIMLQYKDYDCFNDCDVVKMMHFFN